MFYLNKNIYIKQKEDPKQALEIRGIEQEYERRHAHLQFMFESVMQAQRVKLDDIPLPDFDSIPMPPGAMESMMLPMPIIPPIPEIPMPPSAAPVVVISALPTKSILKTKSDASLPASDPPGPPPGTPPNLSDFECDDDDDDNEEVAVGGIEETAAEQAKKTTIRFGAVETALAAKVI